MSVGLQFKTAKVGSILRVTLVDIWGGQRKACSHCPVALAGTRTFGFECKVTTGWIDIGGRRFALPEAAMCFIENFDACVPVEPFTFALGETL